MVGGMLTHLKVFVDCNVVTDHKIHELLAEAENERKHLMFFMEVVHPSILEIYHHYCAIIFWHYYLVLYILFPKTAHRMVGYFEEEVCS